MARRGYDALAPASSPKESVQAMGRSSCRPWRSSSPVRGGGAGRVATTPPRSAGCGVRLEAEGASWWSGSDACRASTPRLAFLTGVDGGCAGRRRRGRQLTRHRRRLVVAETRSKALHRACVVGLPPATASTWQILARGGGASRTCSRSATSARAVAFALRSDVLGRLDTSRTVTSATLPADRSAR